jgi:hypothetical protein
MQQMMTGAIAVGWLIAGLFFLRFWRQTHDRFFLWFALSFWLESANRIAIGFVGSTSEANPGVYGLRVVAYGLILLAIWQKNRPRK